MPGPVLPILFATGAVAVGALAQILHRSAHERVLSELRSGTTKQVGSLTDADLARVVGRADVVDRTLRAPLSGRICVAWQVSVWRPLGPRSWAKIDERAEHVPFAVVDGSGRAFVDTSRAQSYAVVDHEERLAEWGSASPGAIAFLGTPPGTLVHLKESILAPDEAVVVVGKVRRQEDDGGRSTYRRGATEARIEIVAPPLASVLFSDAPEAIDPVGRV